MGEFAFHSPWWEEEDPDRGPTFLRFTEGGRVHVLRGEEPWAMVALGQTLDEVGPMQALMAHQVALCGAKGEPGYTFGVEVFADDDLCVRCASIVPEEHRVRLFEHDTSG